MYLLARNFCTLYIRVTLNVMGLQEFCNNSKQLKNK